MTEQDEQSRPTLTAAPRTHTSADRRSLGFFAICLGYFVIILDASVLNVAIPAIRDGLGGSMASAQWVLNAYTLSLAALLLTAGALGDRIGLRRTLLAGVLLFTAASAACAAAPDTAALIAARAVQGVGAAALLPATLALVPHLFTEENVRARAAVIWVATGSISMAVGPLVGGLLIDAVGWRAIFLINLPIGLAAWSLAALAVPETPRRRTTVDRLGQVTAAASLALLTAGLIRGGEAGWTAPSTLGLIAAAVAAGVGFGLTEHRSRRPMLPLSFFADRLRTSAVLSAGVMGFLFYGGLFVMSLYFQQLRGWSPGAAGVALLPMTVGSTVGPLILYRSLANRYGHRGMLLAGFGCCGLGVAALAWATPGGGYPRLAVGLFLVGVSSTTAFSALTSLLLAGVPKGQSGLASGVQNTTRQSGALIAVAVLGSLLNTSSPHGQIPIALAVLGVAAAGGICLSLLALRATGGDR